MPSPHLLGIAAILVLCAQPGCAPGPSTHTLDRLGRKVEDLTRHVAQQQRALEDLSSRVALIARREASPRPSAPSQARPEAAAQRTAPAPGSARPPLTSAPPQQAEEPATAARRRRLPVVKLRDEDPGAPRGGKAVPRTKESKPEVLRLIGAPSVSPSGPAGASGGGSLSSPLNPTGDRLPVVPLPDAPSPKTAGPEQDFRAAKALLAGRRHAEAARAFSRLAKAHPKHPLAPSATYYVAECAFQQGQLRRAAWVLRGLLGQHPSAAQAPIALLKLSQCEEQLGRRAEAKRVLAQVVQLYPRSPEAAEAARRMRGLR